MTDEEMNKLADIVADKVIQRFKDERQAIAEEMLGIYLTTPFDQEIAGGRQPPNLETKTMTAETMNTEQSRVEADCPNERVIMPEFIEVPICIGFEPDKQIGVARISKDSLPDSPEWVLSLGIKATKLQNGSIAEYELIQFGLIDDANYRGYLDQKA